MKKTTKEETLNITLEQSFSQEKLKNKSSTCSTNTSIETYSLCFCWSWGWHFFIISFNFLGVFELAIRYLYSWEFYSINATCCCIQFKLLIRFWKWIVNLIQILIWINILTNKTRDQLFVFQSHLNYFAVKVLLFA